MIKPDWHDTYLKIWYSEHRQNPHVLYPTINKRHVKRLAALSPNFKFEWNMRKSRWEIIHYRAGELPYCAVPICYEDGSYRPVDERAFEDLYYSLWFSMHSGYNTQKLLDKHIMKLAHRNAHFEDELRYTIRQYNSVIRSNIDNKFGRYSNAMQTYQFPVGIQL